MVAKGLTVREAATRLKIGKTALYEAFRICTDSAAQPQTRIGQPNGTDLA
jgi:hypothetical protein